ncbi:hypothetical protein M2262_003572 [Pseudomonas sp. BIGb0408]|uniref:Uncharacterized protein n=1 Tax=Phytopseudomonas flavescens TaxID=29435 RepID=A0A7Y9XIM3_9GAMM|nr:MULTISPECIES: hypothetical protein [Pseudomonas]MCW2293522.1 hypothetical protein [Pseudomonas sp. BIGb0408]NYH71907.1 hypothetical protein [Pseudomonas flavescens]
MHYHAERGNDHKSRKLGFLDYQASDDAFFAVFEHLRDAKLIP